MSTESVNGEIENFLEPAIFLDDFTPVNVKELTGWSEARYRTKKKHLTTLLRSRWNNFEDINVTTLRSYLEKRITLLRDDLDWFRAACVKYGEPSTHCGEKLVTWYYMWALYIIGQHPWEKFLDHDATQSIPSVERQESVPVVAQAEPLRARGGVEEDRSGNDTTQDMRHSLDQTLILHSTRPDNLQSAPPCRQNHYRWDSAYLHITLPDTGEVKDIALGSLIPKEEGLDCHYLKFNHAGLLQELASSNVMEDKTDFQLIYKRGDREFDLANAQGYFCALGDFCRQPGASKHSFEPMSATFKSLTLRPQQYSYPSQENLPRARERRAVSLDTEDDEGSDSP